MLLRIIYGVSQKFQNKFAKSEAEIFRAVNAIFSKIGGSASPAVVISLVESYCVPILLYGSDCVELSKSLLQSLENAYSQLYSKLFHTFDKNIIRQCQFYSGQIPKELTIANKRFNFLKKISLMDNKYCKYFDLKNSEVALLVNKYCCASDDRNINIVTDSLRLQNINWNLLLRKYFERSLEQFV